MVRMGIPDPHRELIRGGISAGGLHLQRDPDDETRRARDAAGRRGVLPEEDGMPPVTLALSVTAAPGGATAEAGSVARASG